MIKAAESGRIEEVRRRLNAGEQVNQVDGNGCTAMIWAAMYGHTDSVLLLLDRGADANMKNNVSGCTAMMYAAKNGHTDTVLLLLDRGADASMKNNHGNTALSLADKHGNSSIASLLRSRANDRRRKEAALRRREEAAQRSREEAAQRSREEAAQRSREEAAASKHREAAAKHSEAAAKYSEALNSYPHDATLFSARGACHISLSQWEEALRDAISALDRDPSLIQGYRVKAVALQQLGQVDAALEAAQCGLAFDRDNEDLQKIRMVLGKEKLLRLVEEAEQALVSGRMSALRTIEEGLRIDPEHPVLRRLLTELDFSTRDDDGNTPLLFAVENSLLKVLLNIYSLSPWHSVNNSNQAFLDVALETEKLSSLGRLGSEIESSARTALSAADSDPSHSWAACKHFNGATCPPMDKLMDMIGLRAVKRQAIGIFQSVRQDLARRSAKARITSSQAMNFLFLGNPGTGKTTVAKLFGDILFDLGVREKGSFVKTSGEKLLQEGSTKFAALLASATPGILFIDEVYQLDPLSNREGASITNMLMEATENNRDQLTVIVAGYKEDVQKKWIAYNSGLSSRFPSEITFEDFNENELRLIFQSSVRENEWKIELYKADSGHSVDPSKVAALRLSRGASGKGFSNARTVRALKERAMNRASTRQMAEELGRGNRTLPAESVTLTLIDILGPPPDLNSALVAELKAMVGLKEVKDSVMGLIAIAATNYQSELRGERTTELPLHRMFLGNPGTGKTTTAEIYGKLLNQFGYLASGEVVNIGASKLMGSAVGETAKKVNDLMDSVRGKVLVIDEAYVLGGRAASIYGKEALDALVERVQGTAAEDFVVILCGYEQEMKEMLRTGNPELDRRFRSEDAFHFADYSDPELVEIMLRMAKGRDIQLSPDIAMKAVTNVLSKQRSKPNFGNAGAVLNLLTHGLEVLMRRDDKVKENGRWLLLESDLFAPPPLNSAYSQVLKMVNADNVLEHIRSLEKRVKVLKNRQGDLKTLLNNYAFVGPPGTGKTTVARAFGEVFHGLELLASAQVVECKAMDLIGQALGTSNAIMKAKMDEARGGVLFIDEAYGLSSRSGSLYAKEALEMLLANMTDPKYMGNMVIILAGYDDQIEELMSSNPGLRRRVPERLEFDPWAPKDCLKLLSNLCVDNESELSADLHELVLDGFASLSERDGFGNAGDVETVYKKMDGLRADDCDEDGNVSIGFAKPIVEKAFSSLLKQRRSGSRSQSRPGNQQSAYSYSTQQNTGFAPRSAARQDTQKSEAENVKTETRETEDTIDDDTMWSALEAALAEAGFSDLYEVRDIYASKNIPQEVLDIVARTLGRSVVKVRPMLERQCGKLLPRIVQLITMIEEEQEKQRLFE